MKCRVLSIISFLFLGSLNAQELTTACLSSKVHTNTVQSIVVPSGKILEVVSLIGSTRPLYTSGTTNQSDTNFQAFELSMANGTKLVGPGVLTSGSTTPIGITYRLTKNTATTSHEKIAKHSTESDDSEKIVLEPVKEYDVDTSPENSQAKGLLQRFNR
jgi:hypothetical protein